MTKLQLGVILTTLALFFVLYFGCDTKPKAYEEVVQSRAMAAQSTNIETLLISAKKELQSSQFNGVLALEKQWENASTDSAKIESLKQLSEKWYDIGRGDIAGHYAMEVAEMNNTDEAWSIAGTTFNFCIQRAKETKIKAYCTDNAIKSFEHAISLNPANPRHQLNLSLVYIENSPPGNPMKGVKMLVEVNKKFPNHVGTLTQLGRLSIQTAQFQKAIQRLEKALEIEPENADAICLMAKAYRGLEETEKALLFQNKCDKLSINKK